jgi:hypothetical protein
MLFSNVFTATALLAAQAAAHGAVTSYEIDGVKYPGSVNPTWAVVLMVQPLTCVLRYTGFSPASSPKTIQRQWPGMHLSNSLKCMC